MRMYEKLTIRIHRETQRKLKEVSAQLGHPVAEVLRQWLDKYPIDNPDEERLTKSQILKLIQSLRPIIFETNLLLRKLAHHINPQILTETDAQLEWHINNYRPLGPGP